MLAPICKAKWVPDDEQKRAWYLVTRQHTEGEVAEAEQVDGEAAFGGSETRHIIGVYLPGVGLIDVDRVLDEPAVGGHLGHFLVALIRQLLDDWLAAHNAQLERRRQHVCTRFLSPLWPSEKRPHQHTSDKKHGCLTGRVQFGLCHTGVVARVLATHLA